MQLTWKASESASALHAVTMLAEGRPLTDSALATELIPYLEQLTVLVGDELQLPLVRTLAELAASGIDGHQYLAHAALRRRLGVNSISEVLLSSLTAWLASLQATFRQHSLQRERKPLAESLLMRGGPLRSQWDARGPGLLKAFARLTEPRLVAEQATVVLVAPAVGGYGIPHLGTNCVSIEALLSNVDEALPEVVRLGWLLAQLQGDLPAIADHLPRGQVAPTVAAATLPPVLAAAEYVEAISSASSVFSVGNATALYARAAQLWGLANNSNEAVTLAKQLDSWWATYQQQQVTWPVALAALAASLDF